MNMLKMGMIFGSQFAISGCVVKPPPEALHHWSDDLLLTRKRKLPKRVLKPFFWDHTIILLCR